MTVIPLHIVDAFAERPFSGNPAAIIPNAAGLSEREMAMIGEEVGMEVGFVLPAQAREADVRLRFFAGRREDSLSGHVLIAAFTSMADRGIFRPLPGGRLLRVETLAGILEVTITERARGQTTVTYAVPTVRFGEPVPASEVAPALGLPADLLRIDGHGPQRVSCGFDHLVVPVADHDALRGRFGNLEKIAALTDARGVAGVVLFGREASGAEADFQCRFFHPSDRCVEDAASGNGLGALGAYVVQNRLVAVAEVVRIVTSQGLALGRPSRAHLAVRMQGDAIRQLEISATGAVVMRGSFQFDNAMRVAGA
jgi:trans-2,3-dihydro-3-hydroxyanthranilate isomerase